MKIKTRKFVDGGIEFTIPSYMWNKRKEISNYVFKKLVDRLEKDMKKKAQGGE